MKQAASVHLHMQALSDHARSSRAHLPVQAGIARPRSRKLVTSIRPRKTRACMFAQASHRHESRAHLRVNLKIPASQPALPKTQRSVSECMAFKTRPEIRLYIYAADCINAHASHHGTLTRRSMHKAQPIHISTSACERPRPSSYALRWAFHNVPSCGLPV